MELNYSLCLIWVGKGVTDLKETDRKESLQILTVQKPLTQDKNTHNTK